MVLVSSVNCPLTVFFSLMVTTKLSSSRMSWNDQIVNVGGQTVAVGPAVGCTVAISVGRALAFTVAAAAGSADEVGASCTVGSAAGLQACNSMAHRKTRRGMNALMNMIEDYTLQSHTLRPSRRDGVTRHLLASDSEQTNNL